MTSTRKICLDDLQLLSMLHYLRGCPMPVKNSNESFPNMKNETEVSSGIITS